MNQKTDPALMLFSLSYRGKLINGGPYLPSLMRIGDRWGSSPPSPSSWFVENCETRENSSRRRLFKIYLFLFLFFLNYYIWWLIRTNDNDNRSNFLSLLWNFYSLVSTLVLISQAARVRRIWNASLNANLLFHQTWNILLSSERS